MLKFYWNGIREYRGNLQRAHYSDGQLINFPAGTLTIYAKDYSRFSTGIQSAFKVVNDTDSQADYFETDRIRVEPNHPYYAQVLAAFKAQEAHNAKRHANRVARATANTAWAN